MKLSYDAEKRALTLLERGLDFDDAVQIFSGPEYTTVDDRADYGEVRRQTFGLLKDRLVVVVWTERGEGRQIISMRKCNDRERKRYERELDRSG